MKSKSIHWFRLFASLIDNEAIRLLAFEDRWHYVALHCLKALGVLDAGDEPTMLRRKVAVKLGLQLRELEAAAARIAELGLIDAETFQPVDWNSQQFPSVTDPTAATRMRRFREKNKPKKQTVTEVTDELRVTPVTVTATDTDTDIDIETTTTDETLLWDFLSQLSPEERVVAAHKLKAIEPAKRQNILDELAGAIRTSAIKGSWPQWLHGVIHKADRGEFQPSLALDIQRDRRQRTEADEAAAKRRTEAAERDARNSDPAVKAKNSARLNAIGAIFHPSGVPDDEGEAQGES